MPDARLWRSPTGRGSQEERVKDQALRKWFKFRPTWEISRGATQSLANNTLETITWDTEGKDTHGFISVSSTTVTIPSGCEGLYALVARGSLSVIQTVRAFAEINHTSHGNHRTVFTTDDSWHVGTTMRLAAGDTLIVRVFQATSSPGTLAVGATFRGYRLFGGPT